MAARRHIFHSSAQKLIDRIHQISADTMFFRCGTSTTPFTTSRSSWFIVTSRQMSSSVSVSSGPESCWYHSFCSSLYPLCIASSSFLFSSSFRNFLRNAFYFSHSFLSRAICPTFFRSIVSSASIFFTLSSFITPFFLLSSLFIFWMMRSWISLAFDSYSLGTLVVSSLGTFEILLT